MFERVNLAELAEQNLKTFGEYERLVFEGRSFTNLELHEQSRRLARALTSLGVQPGDRVVVLLPNCAEVLVCYPGIWRAGAVAVPVLFLLEAKELAFVLRDSGARVVITSSLLRDKVATAASEAPDLTHVIVVGDAPAGTIAFDALLAEHEPDAAPVPRAPSDLAVVLYTSGTTGQPKGVMQTHHNLYSACMNSRASSPVKDRRDVGLLVLPLAHSFGLGVLVGGYLAGGKAILLRWFDPEAVLRAIQEHRVQAMAGVPTMFVYLLAHPRAREFDTSTMERWLVGAAPMPPSQLQEFERTFGGTMYVGYGLTESCPGIAVEREGEPRKSGSTGRAMEGVTVKVIDEAGAEVAPGELGEICARGDNISPGYFGLPEATGETFKDGWLHTGDIGLVDADGYLFIVERKKDLVIRGGFNVYPKDVESVLHTHPAVLEAAVVGCPDPMMGEEVCAFVVLRAGVDATEEELRLHCQASLAKYKSPRHVAVVPALPKTTIGKIQKKELRRIAAERFAAT